MANACCKGCQRTPTTCEEQSLLHQWHACNYVAQCHFDMYSPQDEQQWKESRAQPDGFDDTSTHPKTSASPAPTSQGLPSLFFPGFPGGAAQAPAEWRRTTASTTAPPQKKVVSGAAGNENIPTTGGDGGWRHTLPAKEGNALTPPGLPIDQRRHTSAWQRWKPRRKTANICSGLVRGPALIEGKRLETRG